MVNNIGDIEFDVEADLNRFASILEPQVKAAVERAEKRFGTLDITADLQTKKLQAEIKAAQKSYEKLADSGEDAEKTEAARLRLLSKQNSLVRLQAREQEKLGRSQMKFLQGVAKAAEKRAKAEASAAAQQQKGLQEQTRLAARFRAEQEKAAKAAAKATSDAFKAQIKVQVDRQTLTSSLAELRAAFTRTDAMPIKTEVDQAKAIASLERLKARLDKAEANIILHPEIDSGEARAEIAALRAQIAATNPTIQVETEVEEPKKGVLARLSGIFRRAGDGSGKAFSGGFGQSFKGQIFSDPQAAILKLSAVFATLTTAVTPIGPLMVGLAASLAALGGIIGTVGIAAGVAAIGMKGFFGAVKEGGAALDGLTPSARETAESIRGLSDEWGGLRNAVQESIFSQVGSSFDRLSKTITTGLQPGMVKIGASIGKIIDAFADWAGSSKGIELISTVMNRVADVFERLRPGIQAFGVGLLQLFNAALPGAGDMADSFSDIGKSFERWTAGLDDGKVNKISLAIGVMADGFRDLGKVFGPVLSGLGDLFEDLSPAIDGFRKALFPILETIGKDLGDALSTLGPVLAGIVDSFSGILKAVQPLAPVLLPVLGAILAFTAGGPVGLIAGLAVAFGSLAAKSKPLREGFSAFFQAIKPVIDQGLKQMQPLVKDLMVALGELGKALAPLAKLLLRAMGPVIANQLKIFFVLMKQALKQVSTMVKFTAAILRGDWSKAWKNGLSLFRFFTPFTKVIDAIVRKVRSMTDGSIAVFRRLRDTTRGIFEGLSSIITFRVKVITGVFTALRTSLGRIPRSFSEAKTAISRAWSGIAAAIRDPLRDVRNKALVPFLRAIGKLPGVPDYSKSIPGFASGGYTGPGAKFKVAGVVHADEFVMSKAARRRLESQAPGALDYMNRTGRWPDGAQAFRRAARRARDGYAKGGRVYPVTSRTMGRGYAGHTGVDFPVPSGTKVMSAINGIVSAVRHLTYSYGKHVRIQGEGVETIYAHLSSTLARVGQRVTAGQIIGLSGSTGNSTGPHLHFEVRPPGTQAGTRAWLAGAGAVAPHKGFNIPNPKDFLSKLGTSGFLNSREFFGEISKDMLSGIRKKFDLFDFLFDSGGVANGKGIMHKATLEPERVLSPAQTRAFQQMVDANFGQGPNGNGASLDIQAIARLLNSIQIVVQPGMDRRATAQLWLNGQKYAEALA